MAQLFQAESVRFGLLPKKLVTDTLCCPPFDQCQTFVLKQLQLGYPCSSSSSLPPVFCTSSNKKSETKPRKRRTSTSTMPDIQLRKELQLFVSSQGLPPDKVPSTKELSTHGREDLAKIVRRRGYKAIQALLTGSNTNSGSTLDSAVLSLEDGSEASTRQQNSIVLGDEQVPKKSSMPDNTGQSLNSSVSNLFTTSQGDVDTKPLPEIRVSAETIKNSNGSLTQKQGEEDLRRRAAEFVRTGQLGQASDSDGEDEEDDDELYEDSSEDEMPSLRKGQSISEGIALAKAAKLQEKLMPFFMDNAPESLLASPQGFKALEELNQVSAWIQQDNTLETDFELQEIKSALINKERELRELSRDLEETKAQLALIQAKATAEVAQAKQLVLEKDIRLKSVDLALANLKQVQVEYWGEGERVELAGSFNGWKYFIMMEPDPTSEISKPDGSRGPMMWETELWLYPGVYEVKFIIDGIWQIDQRREIVTRNAHQNNLLRVEP